MTQDEGSPEQHYKLAMTVWTKNKTLNTSEKSRFTTCNNGHELKLSAGEKMRQTDDGKFVVSDGDKTCKACGNQAERYYTCDSTCDWGLCQKCIECTCGKPMKRYFFGNPFPDQNVECIECNQSYSTNSILKGKAVLYCENDKKIKCPRCINFKIARAKPYVVNDD